LSKKSPLSILPTWVGIPRFAGLVVASTTKVKEVTTKNHLLYAPGLRVCVVHK